MTERMSWRAELAATVTAVYRELFGSYLLVRDHIICDECGGATIPVPLGTDLGQVLTLVIEHQQRHHN